MRSRTAVGASGSSDLVDDLAVGEEDDPVGVGAATGSWVTITMVWPSSRTAWRMNAEDLGAGAAVEVAGGLVGEDDLRPAGQRPGHGDPLLLAARELARAGAPSRSPRPTVSTTWSTHAWSGLRAGQVHRQRDVLDARVSVGTRLNAWKMKPIRSRRSSVSCWSLERR